MLIKRFSTLKAFIKPHTGEGSSQARLALPEPHRGATATKDQRVWAARAPRFATKDGFEGRQEGSALAGNPGKSSMDIPGNPGYPVCSSEDPALRNKTAATARLHPSSVPGVEFQDFP